MVLPSVIEHACIGAVSPEAPPNFSPSHFLVLAGSVVVVPEQVSEPTVGDLSETITELAVNVLSTAAQVSSTASQVPVELRVGIVTALVSSLTAACNDSALPFNVAPV